MILNWKKNINNLKWSKIVILALGKKKKEEGEKERKEGEILFSDIYSAVTEKFVYLLHPPLDRAEVWTACLGHIVLHSDRSDRS